MSNEFAPASLWGPGELIESYDSRSGFSDFFYQGSELACENIKLSLNLSDSIPSVELANSFVGASNLAS